MPVRPMLRRCVEVLLADQPVFLLVQQQARRVAPMAVVTPYPLVRRVRQQHVLRVQQLLVRQVQRRRTLPERQPLAHPVQLQHVRQVPTEVAARVVAVVTRVVVLVVPVPIVEAVHAVAVRIVEVLRVAAVIRVADFPVVVLVAAVVSPVAEAAEAAVAVPDAIDKQNKVVKRPPYLFTCMRALVRCKHVRRI